MALPGDKLYDHGVAAGAATPPAGCPIKTITLVTDPNGAGATFNVFGNGAVFVPPGCSWSINGDDGWTGDGTLQVVFAGDLKAWYVDWKFL